jgi:hypothetical protein
MRMLSLLCVMAITVVANCQILNYKDFFPSNINGTFESTTTVMQTLNSWCMNNSIVPTHIETLKVPVNSISGDLVSSVWAELSAADIYTGATDLAKSYEPYRPQDNLNENAYYTIYIHVLRAWYRSSQLNNYGGQVNVTTNANIVISTSDFQINKPTYTLLLILGMLLKMF